MLSPPAGTAAQTSQAPPSGRPIPTSACVILCTRNRAAQLGQALHSLAAMAVDASIQWEVLVVDNGSSDDTRGTVRRFEQAYGARFRYTFEPTPGKTFALNRGLREASGEVFAFTDDDAIVAPDWLAAMLSCIGRHGADGVGGRVVPLWEAPRPHWLADRHLNVLALLDCGEREFRLSWRAPPYMLYGVNFAFRRDVFARFGAFDTTLGSRGEDQELFDRLAANDASVYYDPTVVVQHVIPGARLTKRYYRDWYRATGQTRGSLEQPRGRHIAGIPLFTLANGAAALMRFVRAALTLDRAGLFENSLWLRYYRAFYVARLRAHLRRGAAR